MEPSGPEFFLCVQVSLVYSCNGVPAAAVGAILAQLLASAAGRPPAQVQNRGAGRGTVRGVSGEEEIPVSRECNWSGPESQHGGLLGGVLTPPHQHRQQQRHAPPSRPPQESHRHNPAPPLSEASTEHLSSSQFSGGGLATASSAAAADRALTPNNSSSCGQLSHIDGQSRQAGTGSTVGALCGPSTTSAPPIADGPTAKAEVVTTATSDSPATVGVHASCRLGPAEARAIGKAAKPARSGKSAAGNFKCFNSLFNSCPQTMSINHCSSPLQRECPEGSMQIYPTFTLITATLCKLLSESAVGPAIFCNTAATPISALILRLIGMLVFCSCIVLSRYCSGGAP